MTPDETRTRQARQIVDANQYMVLGTAAVSGEPPTVTIGQACKLPGNSNAQNCGAVYANCEGLDAEKASQLRRGFPLADLAFA